MTVPSWSEMLPIFEGETNYMYLDDAGRVTAGVGHELLTSWNAVDLFGDPKAAEDWEAVKAMRPGLPASEYAPATTVRLTQAQINARKAQDIDIMADKLGTKHPNSSTWPAPARDVALDILYNTGLIFFHMTAAMDARDWKTAATESLRKQTPDENGKPVPGGIQKSRNDWARDSILSLIPAVTA